MSCGSCTFCCKYTEVPEFRKPDNRYCNYCIPNVGCSKYETRPDSCRNFNCFWLAEKWPGELRPDKCSVMFQALPGVTTILAIVAEEKPDAWMDKKIIEVIGKLNKKGRSVIVKETNGAAHFFMVPGVTKKDIIDEIQGVLRNYGSTVLCNRP